MSGGNAKARRPMPDVVLNPRTQDGTSLAVVETSVVDPTTGEIIGERSRVSYRLHKRLPQRQFRDLFIGFQLAEGAIPWYLGDLKNQGQAWYGEHRLTQWLVRWSGKSPRTIDNYAWVCSVYAPEDRWLAEADPPLSISHYYELATIYQQNRKLALEVLQKARDEDWDREYLRTQVRTLKLELEDMAVRSGQLLLAPGTNGGPPVEVSGGPLSGPVLDEPLIITGIHKPSCPTCSCIAPRTPDGWDG